MTICQKAANFVKALRRYRPGLSDKTIFVLAIELKALIYRANLHIEAFDRPGLSRKEAKYNIRRLKHFKKEIEIRLYN